MKTPRDEIDPVLRKVIDRMVEETVITYQILDDEKCRILYKNKKQEGSQVLYHGETFTVDTPIVDGETGQEVAIASKEYKWHGGHLEVGEWFVTTIEPKDQKPVTDKSIMDELWAWTNKRVQVMPYPREFIEKLANLATEKVQREAIAYRRLGLETIDNLERVTLDKALLLATLEEIENLSNLKEPEKFDQWQTRHKQINTLARNRLAEFTKKETVQ